MSPKSSTAIASRMALIVHPDMSVLSALQTALSAKGFTVIVARDLATALLAITHHYFELAIVSSQMAEGGDGWPLAGVLHLVFPRAFVCVVSPVEPDVLTLQAAINYGVREVYRQSTPAPEVVDAIVQQLGSGSRSSGKARIQ